MEAVRLESRYRSPLWQFPIFGRSEVICDIQPVSVVAATGVLCCDDPLVLCVTGLSRALCCDAPQFPNFCLAPNLPCARQNSLYFQYNLFPWCFVNDVTNWVYFVLNLALFVLCLNICLWSPMSETLISSDFCSWFLRATASSCQMWSLGVRELTWGRG